MIKKFDEEKLEVRMPKVELLRASLLSLVSKFFSANCSMSSVDELFKETEGATLVAMADNAEEAILTMEKDHRHPL